MNYGVPFRADDGKHKYFVWVYDPARGAVLVKFGSAQYQDFREHGDWLRRASYLRRSAAIRDGNGRLTSGNPLSPNYWARRYGWLSREPYVYVGP